MHFNVTSFVRSSKFFFLFSSQNPSWSYRVYSLKFYNKPGISGCCMGVVSWYRVSLGACQMKKKNLSYSKQECLLGEYLGFRGVSIWIPTLVSAHRLVLEQQQNPPTILVKFGENFFFQFAFSFCLKLVNRQSLKDKGERKEENSFSLLKRGKSWVCAIYGR